MHMHDHNCTAHQLRSDVKDACACQFVWQKPLAFSRSLSPRILMPSCDGCPCYMEHRAGAYVSISTFPALFSLPPTDDEMMTQRFRNTYRVLGTLMSFLPREGCDQRHIGVYRVNNTLLPGDIPLVTLHVHFFYMSCSCATSAHVFCIRALRFPTDTCMFLPAAFKTQV